MFDNQRIDLLLDGLKSKHFIGLKSNILCHPTLRNDFSATAAHIKDMVNRLPEIHTVPGCQVSAMGGCGGRGRGTGRGGCDGRAGRDRRGGRGFGSGRGHGGRGNDPADLVTTSQAQPPSDLKTALTKTPLTA